MPATLLTQLRADLARVAVPENAPAMQAYMKSTMPFLGASAAGFRTACKNVFADLQFTTAARWRRAALGVWRGAPYREERYGAIELTGIRQALPFQTMNVRRA